MDLYIGGLLFSGLEFERFLTHLGEPAIRVDVSGLEFGIGEVVEITDGRANLLLLPSGVAGQIEFAGNPFSIPNVTLTVDGGFVDINTLGYPVTEELTAGPNVEAFSLPQGPYVCARRVPRW